jgi:hypothetical protein
MKFTLQLAVLAALASAALAQNQPLARPEDEAVAATSQATSPATSPATSGGGVAAGKSKFCVVRSISGSAGAHENGSYIIRDP